MTRLSGRHCDHDNHSRCLDELSVGQVAVAVDLAPQRESDDANCNHGRNRVLLRAQERDDIRQGHDLAVAICGLCHVAAADQTFPPEAKPPAPPFSEIAQRMDADALTKFMTTTHRGLDEPSGMPNPQLMDYQIKQIVAYIVSLRK